MTKTTTYMLIKLVSGEEFRTPLERYQVLDTGVISLNTDKGHYTIFPIAVAYILKEKYSGKDEKADDKD